MAGHSGMEVEAVSKEVVGAVVAVGASMAREVAVAALQVAVAALAEAAATQEAGANGAA